MAEPRSQAPPIDPMFDGHPERGLLDLSPEERLDWIWECMVLLRAGMGLSGPVRRVDTEASGRGDPAE